MNFPKGTDFYELFDEADRFLKAYKMAMPGPSFGRSAEVAIPGNFLGKICRPDLNMAVLWQA